MTHDYVQVFFHFQMDAERVDRVQSYVWWWHTEATRALYAAQRRHQARRQGEENKVRLRAPSTAQEIL